MVTTVGLAGYAQAGGPDGLGYILSEAWLTPLVAPGQGHTQLTDAAVEELVPSDSTVIGSLPSVSIHSNDPVDPDPMRIIPAQPPTIATQSLAAHAGELLDAELAHNEQTASMVSGQLEEEGLGQRLKGAVGYLLDLGGFGWSTTYDLAAGGIVGAMADATAHATHEIGWGNIADAAYEDLKWKFTVGFDARKGLAASALNIINYLANAAIDLRNLMVLRDVISNPANALILLNQPLQAEHVYFSRDVIIHQEDWVYNVSYYGGGFSPEFLLGGGLRSLAARPAASFERMVASAYQRRLAASGWAEAQSSLANETWIRQLARLGQRELDLSKFIEGAQRRGIQGTYRPSRVGGWHAPDLSYSAPAILRTIGGDDPREATPRRIQTRG